MDCLNNLSVFAALGRMMEGTEFDKAFKETFDKSFKKYKLTEEPVDIFAIGEGVHKVYDEIITPAGLEISIFTEMGRYITGPYGYLVSKAIHKKHIYKED